MTTSTESATFDIPRKPFSYAKKVNDDDEKGEGLVMLGVSLEHANSWIEGVNNDILNDEKAGTGTPHDKFCEFFCLKSTGDREDIVMVAKKGTDHINWGRLAMVRIQYHSSVPISWLSDYVINYSNHHSPNEGGSEGLDDDPFNECSDDDE